MKVKVVHVLKKLLIYEELGLSDNEDLPDLEDVFIGLQNTT